MPSREELDVPDVPITGVALKAAAFHLGFYCEEQRNAYVLCKNEENDPRKCIREGRDVSLCSMEFLRKLKKACPVSFAEHTRCLETKSSEAFFVHCREKQAVFDKCMVDELGLERPYYGYFNLPKFVKTDRPLPKRIVDEWDSTPFFYNEKMKDEVQKQMKEQSETLAEKIYKKFT